MHFPHNDFSEGLSIVTGVSVSTDVSLIAVPYFGVTRRALLPIHPRPECTATVL